jgi:hypothetical protein
MKWQMNLLTLLKDRQEQSVALAIDTSNPPEDAELVNNIIKLFQQVKQDTMLVQADFKIRNVSSIDQAEIKYFKHGKASYTEVLEWAEAEKIHTLFYITDVTGHFYEELQIDYKVFWLVPDDFVPRVPFGKAIKIA